MSNPICEKCGKNEAIRRFIVSWDVEGNADEIKWLCWACVADSDREDAEDYEDAQEALRDYEVGKGIPISKIHEEMKARGDL